jgi:hypothetical protein
MSRLNDYLDLDADGDTKSETGLCRPHLSPSAPVAPEQRETLSRPVTSLNAGLAETNNADPASLARLNGTPIPPRPVSGAVQNSPPVTISNATTRAREDRATEDDWRAAQTEAALYHEFQRLQTEGHTLRTAARILGRSPSHFSGDNSRYARFLRDGLAALLPEPREAKAKLGDLSAQIEALQWFIPAAKFFNLKCNSAAGRGSVPEAIRRTISLPALPYGWTKALQTKLLSTINAQLSTPLRAIPACPPEIRAAILAREAQGMTLVPERVARQIIINPSLILASRNLRDWELHNLSAPASARRFNTPAATDGATRQRMQAGDWFGGDDGTPGIAVTVPCADPHGNPEVMTPCSAKFGVLLGRFQWLPFVDCAYDLALGFDYVVRPRGSYRAEDILHGMRTVVRTHGVPRQGWQFEGGTFNSKSVQHAIKAMGCQHWRTYSPHQKVVEILFNKAWTRLAVRFPHADMGRRRGENAENCAIYEACKAGHRDPRRYFPNLAEVVRAFEEVLAEHNRTLIHSRNYGTWIPEEVWTQQLAARPLRQIDAGSDWMFAPFSFERTVKGQLVGGRVPMFEDFSVPFDFTRTDLHLYDGVKVRCHFDPREPNCTATLVLLQNANGRKAGEVIGPARLVNETAGYLRLAMGWAEDDTQAGRRARQQTSAWLRRVSRGIGAGGQVHYSTDEHRDGLGTVTKIERHDSAETRSKTLSDPAGVNPQNLPPAPRLGASVASVPSVLSEDAAAETARRAENLRAIEQFEQRNKRDLLLA